MAKILNRRRGLTVMGINKIPRLHLLFLFVASFVLLSMYSTASPQERQLYLKIKNQKVSANIKNTPLKEVIEEIKQEKDIWFDTGFIQDKSTLDDDISVRFGNVSMKEGLDRILSGINYSMFFQGNKVVGVMLFGQPDKRRVYRTRGRTRSPVTRRSTRQVRRRP